MKMARGIIWEVTKCWDYPADLEPLLEDGWEPYAVAGSTPVRHYLRRQKVQP